MHPENFKEANFNFIKPEDWTDRECGDLPSYRGKDSEGMPVVISKWVFTPEELEKLNTGESLYLTIYGGAMPPVCLQVGSPFLPVDVKEDKP